jgi:hypothetical protein
MTHTNKTKLKNMNNKLYCRLYSARHIWEAVVPTISTTRSLINSMNTQTNRDEFDLQFINHKTVAT